MLSYVPTLKEALFFNPKKYFFEIYVTFLNILLGPNIFVLLDCNFDEH
jgi:hypothetical protein